VLRDEVSGHNWRRHDHHTLSLHITLTTFVSEDANLRTG